MKFLSYNIQYGKGQKGKHNLYRVAEVIKEADIICLQEIEKFWQRSGFVDQAQILSEFFTKILLGLWTSSRYGCQPKK